MITAKKTAAFYTLGCKLNYSETSLLGKAFSENGFDIIEFDKTADVYVINSCTVTVNAEKECRQVVRRALKANPGAYIIVTGCYAQLSPDEIVKIPGVDAVLGSNEKFRLFSLIESFEKREHSCIFVSPADEMKKEFHFAYSSESDSRTRAFLKIQDGCDYKCSFCTIPLARGGSRSIEPAKAVENLQILLLAGFKEIILTGVNVGEYLYESEDFYSLLLKLIAVEGDFRLRISSIEPNLLTDEILQLAKTSNKICKHFHIPLQSGSAKILKLMQRRYTAEFYKKLINKIKLEIPEAGIGVDVIAGFPGESEEDFVTTYEFLQAIDVSYLHVFTYSERPNTKAFILPDKVDIFDRKERNRILRVLSEKKRAEFYKSQVGAVVEPLYEKENSDGIMKGFTSNYIRVHSNYDSLRVNSMHKVKITESCLTHCCTDVI